MAQAQDKCPLCGRDASRDSVHRGVYEYEHYVGCACADYFVEKVERHSHLPELTETTRRQLSALLTERHLRNLPEPLLVFGDQVLPDVDFASPIRTRELLLQWPESVPERIERSFCCLVRRAGSELRAGQRIKFGQDNGSKFLPFTFDVSELNYFVKALVEYDWITTTGGTNPCKAEVPPGGWAKFHELTELRTDRRHPVFVAM